MVHITYNNNKAGQEGFKHGGCYEEEKENEEKSLYLHNMYNNFKLGTCYSTSVC